MSNPIPIAGRLQERKRARALADLPPPDTDRWVASRKAAVVSAVDEGVLSAEEACERYSLSREELCRWRSAYERHGAPALLATKLKRFRDMPG